MYKFQNGNGVVAKVTTMFIPEGQVGVVLFNKKGYVHVQWSNGLIRAEIPNQICLIESDEAQEHLARYVKNK